MAMTKRMRWLLIAALLSVGLWKLRAGLPAPRTAAYPINIYNQDYGSGGSAYL